MEKETKKFFKMAYVSTGAMFIEFYVVFRLNPELRVAILATYSVFVAVVIFLSCKVNNLYRIESHKWQSPPEGYRWTCNEEVIIYCPELKRLHLKTGIVVGLSGSYKEVYVYNKPKVLIVKIKGRGTKEIEPDKVLIKEREQP